jgi:hypothetical protein
MIAIKLLYAANILVAGWIGISSAFFPRTASVTIFQNSYPSSDLVRLVGCLWLGIAMLSVLGLWRPMTFSPVLLLQLIYKGTWLVMVALPAIKNKDPYPQGMAVFFLVWCMILPFVIPWSSWIQANK